MHYVWANEGADFTYIIVYSPRVRRRHCNPPDGVNVPTLHPADRNRLKAGPVPPGVEG